MAIEACFICITNPVSIFHQWHSSCALYWKAVSHWCYCWAFSLIYMCFGSHSLASNASTLGVHNLFSRGNLACLIKKHWPASQLRHRWNYRQPIHHCPQDCQWILSFHLRYRLSLQFDNHKDRYHYWMITPQLQKSSSTLPLTRNLSLPMLFQRLPLVIATTGGSMVRNKWRV